MAGCCVPGCKNNSSKKGFHMRGFPRDPARRQLWTKMIKRENWTPTEYSRICDVHFSPEMWEKNRIDGKRKLKSSAVPTVFSNNGDKINKKTVKDQCVALFTSHIDVESFCTPLEEDPRYIATQFLEVVLTD